MEMTTGFTCNTCGKVFITKEEYDNRHKKKKKKNNTEKKD
jgi:hypothetical protein